MVEQFLDTFLSRLIYWNIFCPLGLIIACWIAVSKVSERKISAVQLFVMILLYLIHVVLNLTIMPIIICFTADSPATHQTAFTLAFYLHYVSIILLGIKIVYLMAKTE